MEIWHTKAQSDAEAKGEWQECSQAEGRQAVVQVLSSSAALSNFASANGFSVWLSSVF